MLREYGAFKGFGEKTSLVGGTKWRYLYQTVYARLLKYKPLHCAVLLPQ